MPVTRKNAITGMGSTSRRPVANSSPIPFQPNTCSVITAPPIRPAKSKAMIVVMGISELRNACFRITWRSGRPLARAVRM